MSDSKLLIVVFSIFCCLTVVQKNHIYSMQHSEGLHTLDYKFTSRLPRIELEANFEDFLSFNKKLCKIQTK
ncbi:hypothetical protein [Desulfurella amilsii]|nr:hypothetical protein [Desulfurella amilsii]